MKREENTDKWKSLPHISYSPSQPLHTPSKLGSCSTQSNHTTLHPQITAWLDAFVDDRLNTLTHHQATRSHTLQPDHMPYPSDNCSIGWTIDLTPRTTSKVRSQHFTLQIIAWLDWWWVTAWLPRWEGLLVAASALIRLGKHISPLRRNASLSSGVCWDLSPGLCIPVYHVLGPTYPSLNISMF